MSGLRKRAPSLDNWVTIYLLIEKELKGEMGIQNMY